METTEKPIHQEVFIPGSTEKVYELFINGAKFGDATGRPGKGGGSEGAYFSLFSGWIEGRQIELKENELIVQAWRFMDWDPGIYSVVRFTLIPEDAGTKIVLDQVGVPTQFHEHIRTNWTGFYFDPIVKYFEN